MREPARRPHRRAAPRRAAPRRIVTAIDESGRSYIARVEEVAAHRSQRLPPEIEARSYPHGVPDVRVVWDCKELPVALPADPTAGPSGRLPGPHGVRVSVTILHPAGRGRYSGPAASTSCG